MKPVWVWAALLVGLTQAGWAPLAAATDSNAALLALDLAACPNLPAGPVANMVGVELRRPVALLADQPTRARAAASTSTTSVQVTCDGLRARIQVRDPLTDKSVERLIDLGDAAPVARPHLLALSIVELLAASWMELENAPAARQPARAPASSESPNVSGREQARATDDARQAALELVRRRPGPPQTTVRLWGAATGQTSTAHFSTWGAALVAGGDPLPHLGWLADLSVQHGERSFAMGRVTGDTVNLLAAASTGLARARYALHAALGVRGGVAWFAGTPAGPPTVGGAIRGAWWGPVAALDAALRVRGRLIVGLVLEAGSVVLPVTATVQGADPVAIDGTWIRGGLGVGFEL